MSGNRDMDGMANAEYGIQGVPSSSNHPRSCFHTVSWVDDKDNLWIFGGEYENQSNYLSPWGIPKYLKFSILRISE